MEGSIQRVLAVVNGDLPDRPPLFDLLRNDAVLEHFTGKRLTFDNAPELVYEAYEPAIDGTRPMVKYPMPAGVRLAEDGREVRQYRWTAWTQNRVYRDAEEYVRVKREQLGAADPSAWDAAKQAWLDQALRTIAEERRRLGEVFLVPSIAGPGLMGLHGEVGLEAFSYLLADSPGIMPELLECNAIDAVTRANHYPEDHAIAVGFLGDDIAFKSGPLLSPAWLRKHYFPRLARIIAAWHAKGIKVLFHSDGNLNSILDDLVEAGIDGLNPIEVMAGMDVGEIHRRHPHLFLAGGIDVSQLLPFGSPDAVREAVKRAIDEAEGRIMVGSSTELNNDVPLENYLALREVVLETAY